MALVSNRRAGLGLAGLGLAIVPFSIHEARASAVFHDRLAAAGPLFVVLGLAMARFPGSGPIGDDRSPSLTPRERFWWIVAGVVGVVAGLAWSETLASRL